jgi:membrane protein implicated in regulation of membrane protease activity
MLGVYLFAAILGAGLLGFGLLAGDGESGEHQVGIADADHPGFGEVVLALFRPRNFIFGAAAFGLTGSLLTLVRVDAGLTLVCAAVLGVAFFLLSHLVFQLLRRTDAPVAPVNEAELAGENARVTMPLEPGRPGRVACIMAGREVHLVARLAPGAAGPLAAGREVVVVAVENGTAVVRPAQQHERQLPA